MNTLYLKSEKEESIVEASKILHRGGLVAIPTETVYGLAADALNPDAVKSIFKAKGRPMDNPLIVHISEKEEIYRLVSEISPKFDILCEKFWPGPLTVIMKKSELVPDEVCAGLETVAIRMPSHPVARKIIKRSGLPLAAPSANASGRPSPTTAEHVKVDLDGKIDAIVDGGPCSVGVESTVITLVTDPPTLLRPGGVTVEQLEEVIGKINVSHAVFEKLDAGEKAQSPGMKYKHYAPKASVTLIKGSFDSYKRFIKAQKTDVCAVCFENEGRFFNKYIEYGKAEDSLTQAQHIFDALRKVDEMGCSRAFVRCPDTAGIGLAVYNRLLRSSAFKVIDLDITIPVIGLTGPTGAGKSTVAFDYKRGGYYIVDADALARKAVENPDILNQLCASFGEDIIDDGKLNRKLLAERAFSSKENTKLLNSVTHPEITRLAIEEIHIAQEQKAPGVVLDAPALLESDLASICDEKICVIADKESRIERIIKRDHITREEVLMRMSIQNDDDYYINNCDKVIRND